MTATYDLTTAVGKVRLAIRDTDITDAVFTDEELAHFLSVNDSSVNLAAAAAFESWAASYAANATSEKMGDYAYTQKAVDNLLAMAKRLRETEAAAPYLTWAEMDLTTYPSET